MADPRFDHYYSLEGDEFVEGHILCTVREAQHIERELKKLLPDVEITVEFGGEYDYTTEETSAEDIAHDIAMDSGFLLEDDE